MQFTSYERCPSVVVPMQPEAVNRTRDPFTAPWLRKYVVLLQVLMHLQMGAMPVLLIPMSKAFRLDAATMGLYGGTVYVAMSIGTGFLSDYMFRRFSIHQTLACAVVGTKVSLILTAMLPAGTGCCATPLLLLRLLYGLCLSIVTAHAPMWTRRTAPKGRTGAWMAVLQAAIPVGVLLGYSTAAFLANALDHRDKPHHWRLVFVLQAFILVPASYLLWYARDEHLGVFPWVSPPSFNDEMAADHRLGNRSTMGAGGGGKARSSSTAFSSSESDFAESSMDISNLEDSREDSSLQGISFAASGTYTSIYSPDTTLLSPSPRMGSPGSAFQPVSPPIRNDGVDSPSALGLHKSFNSTTTTATTKTTTTYDEFDGGHDRSPYHGHYQSNSSSVRTPPQSPMTYPSPRRSALSTPKSRNSAGQSRNLGHSASRSAHRKRGIKQTTGELSLKTSSVLSSSNESVLISPSAVSNASTSPSSSPLRISDVVAREDQQADGLSSQRHEGLLIHSNEEPSSLTRHQLIGRHLPVSPPSTGGTSTKSPPADIENDKGGSGMVSKQHSQQPKLGQTQPRPPPPPLCVPAIASCMHGCLSIRRCRQIMGLARVLVGIPTYASLLLALVSLYFITAGLQFYSTAYFIVGLGMNPHAAYFDVGLTLATAPACGVAAGGTFVELVLGGYRGRKRLAALRRCAYLSMLVTGAAFIALVNPVNQPTAVAACLWVLTFLATAMLPALSGLLVSVVPRELRAASGQSTGLFVNLFGNSLSVVAIGYAMNLFHDEASCDAQCTHVVGFRLLMVWAIWPLVLVSLAALEEIRRRDREIRAQEQEIVDSSLRRQGTAMATEMPTFAGTYQSGANVTGASDFGAILDIRNPTPSPNGTPTLIQPPGSGEGVVGWLQPPDITRGSRDGDDRRQYDVVLSTSSSRDSSVSHTGMQSNRDHTRSDSINNPLAAGLVGFVQGMLPGFIDTREGGMQNNVGPGGGRPGDGKSQRENNGARGAHSSDTACVLGPPGRIRQDSNDVGSISAGPGADLGSTMSGQYASLGRAPTPASRLDTTGSALGSRSSETPPTGSNQYTYYRSQYVALGRGDDGSPPPAL